ncbi:cytochrome P450 [Xylariaceae sp. FL0016]|nr:cytochrome P450 [Xylariaceae sp. FL0016]
MDSLSVHSMKAYVPLFQKILLITVVFTLFSRWLYRALFTIQYPKNLPRIGEKEGKSWKEMRNKFQTDCISLFNDAYENYSKKGKAVLIPVFGPCDEVILPPSSLQWLTRQPDSVASSLHAQIDSIGLDYSLGSKFAHDPWGGMLIKTDLNAALETVCAVMNSEVAAAVGETFKGAEDWKELDLFPACRILAGRATLAFTLGDSAEGRKLCQDEAFVNSCYAVLDGMLDTAGTLAATRKFLKPLHGPWAARAMKAKLNDLKTRIEPLHRERLAILEQRAAGENVVEPQDLFQMMLAYAAKERPAELRNLDDIVGRLAVSNFGTMHQTVITLHNIFLNVIDSDREHATATELRREVARVIMGDASASPGAAYTGTHPWTRAKVSAMTRADSVARETLRAHSFIGRTVQRLVIDPRGLTTEDGVHLPPGTMVSILAHQAQTDPTSFADPETYDPFRFARPREAAADRETGRPGLSHLSFVSTGSDYLPFSHGKHACPGRFLVDFELKMVLAYVLMNYDMEFPESYEGKRPPNFWFAGFGIPPIEAKVRVRRRKTGSSS